MGSDWVKLLCSFSFLIKKIYITSLKIGHFVAPLTMYRKKKLMELNKMTNKTRFLNFSHQCETSL